MNSEIADGRSLLLLDRLEVEQGVEPLSHDHAFPHLHVDLFLAERLEEHEADTTVEGSSVSPAWKKSLAHGASEVAFLDVEHVGGGEDSASEIG